MKKVLNKLLTHNYDCCHNCMFEHTCEITQNDECSRDDKYLMWTYNMSHIFVKDEKSSE